MTTAGGSAQLAVLDATRGGVVLRLRVRPGARKDMVVDVHGDALRLRVSAPAVDGRANRAVEALVADVLGVDRGQVRLTAGARARQKRVRVAGLDLARAEARLRAALEETPER